MLHFTSGSSTLLYVSAFLSTQDSYPIYANWSSDHEEKFLLYMLHYGFGSLAYRPFIWVCGKARKTFILDWLN